ncbi:hypothetical protein ACGFI9_02065 [Micromonospora sp. NPDC048930]|uniref:hypothetical protein n=1 Tax=Micromonospora sp. NPDC048930 TaxID=3364261 RepID=UPI0037131007
MRSDRVGAAGPPAAARGPEWIGTTDGPWPALPDEVAGPGRALAASGAERRPGRDPWPALPDDRELWLPAVGVPDAARLRRLDREQAGG